MNKKIHKLLSAVVKGKFICFPSPEPFTINDKDVQSLQIGNGHIFYKVYRADGNVIVRYTSDPISIHPYKQMVVLL